MTDQNTISDIEKYLYKLRSKENNIDEYYNKELRNLADKSKIFYLIPICKLFETDEQRNRIQRKKELNIKPIENVDVNKLTEQNINDFLKCEWFNSLSNRTKNLHLFKIKKYLKFSGRKDLNKVIGKKKFKVNKKVLSKTDLISREDLELILKHCSLKVRTLLMVLYEGALRKDEALNIRFKDVKFNGGYIILRIGTSKTQKRDIPLTESIPYLKEYFNYKAFNPIDKIFPYKRNTSLNVYLYKLTQKLIAEYPDKWEGRDLYPHLFRHSRLTELARGKLNEAQIRKFAGWEPGSPMPRIYFHLDDQDIINILTKGQVKVPEPKKFKSIICPICNADNTEQNLFCWKCNNILDKDKIKEAGIQLIVQPDKTNKELENRISSLEQKFRMLNEAINKGILIETFPDGVESGSPNDEPIGAVDKYIKIPSKTGKKLVKSIINKALNKE